MNVTHGHLRRTRGQGLTEYSLILLLVSIFLIAALRTFGLSLQSVFQDLSNRFP
jgi:Flp pilus assembly pilin Flp